jgi:putative ABC transport system substrate-binding protein
MRRRKFVALLGGVVVAWPFAARAQHGGKIPRVGFMGNSHGCSGGQSHRTVPRRPARARLPGGRNVEIVYRWAEGSYERFPDLIAELIAANVDVIVTAGTPAALAVKKGDNRRCLWSWPRSAIPSAPASCRTWRGQAQHHGLSALAPDLEANGWSCCGRSCPTSPTSLFSSIPRMNFIRVVRQALAAAQALEYQAASCVRCANRKTSTTAFAAIVKEKPDGLLILADRIFLHNRQRMMDFATEYRLPSVNAYRELVEAGGLTSYGPSYEEMHRRAADYVDRILKGARPGDLPSSSRPGSRSSSTSRPRKALGLEVPPTLVARADEVIE